MMKTKKIGILFVTVAAIAALVFLYIFIFNLPAPQRIYEAGLNNIVEFKAASEGVGESFGTAEIIDVKGTIVTNAHTVTYSKLGVLTEFEEYFIRFSSEEGYREIRLIQYDGELDLAVFQFKELPEFKLKPVKLGDSSKLKSGDTVYAIGNSQNYGIGISKGIISVPLVEIEYSEQKRKVIQCDITVAEGNSGGALLNERGKLIGITTFRIKDNKGNVIYGIAYCIPIHIVTEYISSVNS